MTHLTISLQNTGRRYNREWIFRGVDYQFQSGESYAILGPNGSGKSTLLQVLNGSLSPSEGAIAYTLNQAPLPVEAVYQHLSIAAPYLEVLEEFTLTEMIDFHFQFKTIRPEITKKQIIELLGLHSSRHKAVRYFSSGMKQRLKLALAFCADTPLLVLDEPTSNLDNQGVDWYHQLVTQFSAGRLTLVGSNQEHEYSFCRHQLHITQYKPQRVTR
ncbi:ABC transporter ATP-binding protein [Mucilaginibacter koreensis]